MGTALTARLAQPRTRRLAGLALGAVVLFAAALAAQRLAASINPAQILPALTGLPHWRIAGSVLFTAASYLLLIGYDIVALRAIGEKAVPLRVTARAAFTSYALSHNLGLAPLTGGSARLKIYGSAGLSPAAVARVIVIAGGAFWGGVAIVAACSLAAARAPVHLGPLILSPGHQRMVGAALFGLVACLFGALRRPPALRRLFARSAPGVSPAALGLLIGMGALDLAFSAAALIVLVPGLALADFPQLYVVYAIAILAGLVTHVPGGIGVFEAIMFAGLPASLGAVPAELAAALLAYRVIYYFLPLGLALFINTASEAHGLRRQVGRLRDLCGIVTFELAPTVMGALAFAGGLVLLLSGAVPAAHGRMHALVALLPLPFIEASHLSASLVGTALLLVAPALVDRLESGMRAARLLFMLGAAFSLAKGLDFEEAIVMLTLAGLLQAAAPAFYRRTAGPFGSGNAGWLAAAVLAVALSGATGAHAYRHLAYDNQLWWEFALRGDAPRFLRASFATGIVIAAYAFSRLLHRPCRPAGVARLPEDVFARATAHWPRSDAALAFTGDKRFLIHPSGDAFVMFRQRGRTWVVMGDPVGAEERWGELCWELRRLSDAHYARLCFYQISAALLPLMVELGLRPIKYGEEASVDPIRFTLQGPRMKSLRNGHARALREGLRVKIITPGDLAYWLPALASVSQEWLSARRQREKSFSLGAFSPGYLGRFDTAVVVRECAPMVPLAFANLWRSGDGGELSVDLMRHAESAPPGTMDFLLCELIALAREDGCRRFNLGLAPLSGLQGGKLAPSWARLARLGYAMDAGAYGFAGLRRFKEKFAPDWQPRFIGVPGSLPGLRGLIDLLRLVGGGTD